MNTPVASLLKAFFAICKFSLGPQDLPASNFLLQLAMVAYVTTGFLVVAIQLPPGPAVTVALVDLFVLVVFVMAALKIVQKENRLTQTLTAFAGTGALISALSIPVTLMLPSPSAQAGGFHALSFLTFILLVWDLMIQGHILRHALSIHWAFGVGLALFKYWMLLALLRAVISMLVGR
jgi:hypothetical protein